MKRRPSPRPSIYRLYWYFASERQAAFERRVCGRPGPWSDDRILQTFKFCNVFRASDRVSQYLIRDVAYHDETVTPQDRLFQITAFRTFSKPETWHGLRRILGRYPTLDELADGSFGEGLDRLKEQNGGLYTGAFILCATDRYGQGVKHRNHVELFRHMFLRDALGDRLLEAKSLREVFDLLHGYPLMGDFMSYQTAIDLNYSDLLDFSENEFTKAGPGAIRGLRKAFTDLGDYSPEETILWMVENQEAEFGRFGYDFRGLWGRPLHGIDCQGLFCELDKYCREAAPELASGRKRIKARFAPSSKGIQLYFPPKWKLNDRLPKRTVLGSAVEPAAAVQGSLF